MVFPLVTACTSLVVPFAAGVSLGAMTAAVTGTIAHAVVRGVDSCAASSALIDGSGLPTGFDGALGSDARQEAHFHLVGVPK